MKNKSKISSEIAIYKATKGLEAQVVVRSDTVWLTQDQMANLFDRERSVITKHIKNIFSDKELEEKSNVQILHIANSDKPVKLYSLDVIISAGYRVKSIEATRFRQWATRTLKDHLTKGFTINRQRFEENAAELESALELVRKTSQNPELLNDVGSGLVDVITRYTKTFLLLQKYDEGLLTEPKTKAGGKLASLKEIRKSLSQLKSDLIAKKEATELFAKERQDALEALLGNLEQTVFGKPAYPSLESKAAHLLYFVIKNHPFIDGNKRSAAFLFIDFLNRNKKLFNKNNQPIINYIGLAALTLLVAESNPKNKDVMIKLIMTMLSYS
jgi:prophage maintenance system killer protein